MEQNYQENLLKGGILLICVLTISSGFAQLSGNYTINPTASASSTNYLNWASAVNDLVNGSRSDGGTAQGPGVSSSVTITVYDTTYSSTAIELTAISGASPSRRVTFKSASGDYKLCQVHNPSSSSNTNDYVLYVNGADYVTFQNIGFVRTGTADYSTVVQIGNNARQVTFEKCLMKGRKIPSNSQNGFIYAIGSCFYISGTSDSTLVQNCRLLYGYNGVYTTSGCSDNLFVGNTIDSSGSSGFYMTSQTRLKIRDNTVNLGDFGPNLGHYTSYGMRLESSPAMLIQGNKIYVSAVNCQYARALMVASTTSTAASPTMVYNNWIVNSGGSTDCSGFAAYLCYYLNFYHNNVLVSSPLTNGCAYFHYTQYANSNINIVNNNMINKGAGYVYLVSGTNTSNIDSMDYNNVYSSGNYVADWGGTNYSSLSAFRSGSSKDANSISVDPGYISNRDLHVSSFSLNGKGLKYPWVPVDIDYETRDTSNPDIGADEFFPVANDAGVSSVDSPMVFCPGTHNIRVKVQNFGYDTLKSVQINWKVNGTSQTSYNWTGNVAPGASSGSIILGSFSFSSNASYAFNVWTTNPNGVTDGKKSNDSIKVTRYPGMSGTYSIGDSMNSDFKSFNSAIAAYTARGICGPIKFLVAPGVYNEQLTLLELPGMGSSNPITFEGTTKDSTDVLITLPSTTATGNNNAAVQLRGADYMHFKYITFERTGSNQNAYVVHILNGSDNNSFTNCRMLGLKLTSVFTTAQNIVSDAGVDNGNQFINNTIKFGNNNVSFAGTSNLHETGNVFKGNYFDSAFNSSVQISYNDNLDFSGNTFGRVSTPVSGNFSLLLNDCDLALRVDGNTFRDQGLENSIQLTGCSASSNAPGLIINNMFAKGSGKGILLDGVDYQTIAFNSIYLTSPTSTNCGVYASSTTSSGIVMKNNILFMEGGEAYYIPSASFVSSSDYNDLIVKGGLFATWVSAQSTLVDLRNASGKEANSVSINPFFTSNADLHIFNPLLKGKGVAVAGVSTDYDGETRNSTNPDIGADEFKLKAEDAGIVEMTAPNTSNCAGVNDIKIVIKNFGSDTLTSADIHWTVLGVLKTTYKWTGSLLTNQMDTFIIGTHNFSGNLNPKFAFWTSIPNGVTDLIPFNDSLVLNRAVRSLPVANAGPDQTICRGNIAILGINGVNGHTYEWTDIVSNVLGTTAKLNVTPNVQTTYILEVTNTTFGCKNRDTVEVYVNPIPVANAGTDKTVCYGNTVQIGAASQAGFSYNWSSSVGNFSSSQSDPIVKPLQSTYFILTKIINATGCFDTDTVLVSIAFPPSATISGGTTACQGQELQYVGASVNGNTYAWTINGGQIVSGQNTNTVSVRWNNSGGGTVTLEQTNQANCKDTITYNVQVVKNPIAHFGINEVCLGGSTIFTDSSSDANTYSWNFGNGKTSGQKNPIHTFDSAKTYQVRLIVYGANNCSDTLIRPAQVHPIPIADFDFSKTGGLTYSFTDMSTIASGNVTEWNWNFGDGNVSSVQNPTHVYDYSLLGQSFNVQLCAKSAYGCSSCFNKVLTVTSINPLDKDQLVKLYPNPGTGIFHLDGEEIIHSVELISSLGQTIRIWEANDHVMTMDLNDLAEGVYTLKILMDGRYVYLSIVIQR